MLLDINAVTLIVQIITGALLMKTAPAQKLDTDNISSSNSSSPLKGMIEDVTHEVHFNAPASMGQVFPVVQNEGIVALALLCSMNSQVISRITKFSTSIITTFISILSSSERSEKLVNDIGSQESTFKNGDYSVEIKTNVLTLLKLLVEADPTFAQQVVSTMGGCFEILAVENFSQNPSNNPTNDSQENLQQQEILDEPVLVRTNTSSFKLTNHVSKIELENMFKGKTSEKLSPVSIQQALYDLVTILNLK